MNRRSKKPPLVDRFFERIIRRWLTDPAEATRYMGVVLSGMDGDTAEGLLVRLPLPLAQHGRGLLAVVNEKRQKKRDAAKAEEESRAQKARAHLDGLLATKALLRPYALTLFLAGLTPAERDRICTPAERKAAIALRKNSILAGKVRTWLECTKTELDRWDADGRLPHLFKNRLQFERATDCRLWDQGLVEVASSQVYGWRDQDEQRKKAARGAKAKTISGVVLQISAAGRTSSQQGGRAERTGRTVGRPARPVE